MRPSHLRYLNIYFARMGEAAIFGMVIGLLFLACIGEENVSKAFRLAAYNGIFCGTVVGAYYYVRLAWRTVTRRLGAKK